MKTSLLLIRHGPAEEPQPGQDDASRHLTAEGKRKTRRAMRGLRKLVGSIDLLAVSPLWRAVETAEIVAGVFDITPVEFPSLGPGGAFEELVRELETHGEHRTIALVGHEPALSRAAARWTSGQTHEGIELGKAGAMMLEFGEGFGVGQGRLQWLVRAKMLRAMGNGARS